MEDEFSLSWVSVLDESMVEWLKNTVLVLCVLDVNLTLLKMNAIQSVVHLPRFCSGL